MRRDVLWPSKDIYHVDFSRHINQLSIDFFAENFCDVGIIDGNRNDLEPGAVHVLGNIESRLTSLRFSLDTEHRDRFRLREQFAKLVSTGEDIVAPIHMSHRFTQIDTDSKHAGDSRCKDDARCFFKSVVIRVNLWLTILQKFTPNAAITASTTAMIASPQINPDASGI